MADKQITVAVPEERVPEFYLWFAQFLGADPSAGLRAGGPGLRRGGPRGRPDHPDPEPWGAGDAEQAAWLYGKLAPPARALFDRLLDEPGRRWSGNELAQELGVEKGAHGIAGILAWPGRYCRRLGRELPIATEPREDGGTDYFLADDVAALLAAVRAAAGDEPAPSRGRRRR